MIPRIYWLRIFWKVLPASFILGTAALVLFGEDGFIKRHQTRSALYQMLHDAEQVEEVNRDLRLSIHRLKSEDRQLGLQAAEQLLAAPPDSVIYRFHD